MMIKAIEQHRSVRQYDPSRKISDDLMRELVGAATRASTTGGMQLYSIVVSQSDEVKAELAPLHFNQPMVRQAAAVVTFCADIARFSAWCVGRGADPHYDNFAWFVNASIDALLASQNFALEAENQGLGICYLGTTIYTALDIIRVLSLPPGVVPVATIVVGYASSDNPLTPRLPIEAVMHAERYRVPSAEFIDEMYAPTEASPETAAILAQNDLPNLARVFTERRYTRDDNERISASYFEALKSQGFL